MELIILELLSAMSFYFTILLLFFHVDFVWSIPIFFYCAVIISIFAIRRKEGHWRWSVLMGIFLVLPMFLYFTMERVLFTLTFTLVCIYYYEKVLGRKDIEELSDSFKVNYSIITILVLAGIIASPIQDKITSVLPFMMIYLFTTILLSASLRHTAHGTSSKKNRNRLYIFLSMAMILSLLISVEGIRASILHSIGVIFGFGQRILFFVLYPFLYAALWLFTASGRGLTDLLYESYEEQNMPGGSMSIGEQIMSSQNNTLLKSIMGIGFMAVIIIFVARILKKKRPAIGNSRYYGGVREYLIPEKNIFHRKKRDRFPSAHNAQIRYYYRKYLRRINKKRTIEVSDTSQSIRTKGNGFTSYNEEIRDLYIRFRYSDESADRNSVESMKDYYEA